MTAPKSTLSQTFVYVVKSFLYAQMVSDACISECIGLAV